MPKVKTDSIEADSNLAHGPTAEENGLPPRRGDGLAERMRGLLEENWKNSDSKYRRFRPGPRFRFKAEAIRQMLALATENERNLVLASYRQRPSILRAANEAHMPRALAARIIEEAKSQESPIAPSDTLGRFEFVQTRVLRELEARTTPDRLGELSLDELATLAKLCRENIVTLNESGGGPDSQPMNIITNMPMYEDDEKPH